MEQPLTGSSRGCTPLRESSSAPTGSTGRSVHTGIDRESGCWAAARRDTRRPGYRHGVVYQDRTQVDGPPSLAMAPDGNLIAAQGDAIHSDPNQPSELVEFTPEGAFVGRFSIETSRGGSFGG